MTQPCTNEGIRITMVPVKDIQVRPQVRDALDVRKVAALAGSMRAGGLIYPIKLRRLADGTLVVVDGHYRLSAAMTKLGWTEIPAFIDDSLPGEAEVMGVQLATAECRFALNPMERAHGYDEFLRRSKATAAELAALIGASESQVSKTRALIGIRDDLQALVASGTLAPSVALELDHVADPKQYQAFLEQARSAGGLTREHLVTARKTHRHRRAARKAKRERQLTVKLDHGCFLSVPAGGCTLEQLLSVLSNLAERARQARDSAGDVASLISLVGKPAPA